MCFERLYITTHFFYCLLFPTAGIDIHSEDMSFLLKNGIAVAITVIIFALAVILQGIIFITHHSKVIFAANILIVFRRTLLDTEYSSVFLRYLNRLNMSSLSIQTQCHYQLTVLI